MSFSLGASDSLVFSFLSEVRKKFITTYNYTTLMNYNAYELKKFNEVLKSLIVNIYFKIKKSYYNTNPKINKNGEVIKDIAMKDVMITNSDKVLGLDQKLNILIG
jgi:hypothetical protein